jgi:hypothetical protein
VVTMRVLSSYNVMVYDLIDFDQYLRAILVKYTTSHPKKQYFSDYYLFCHSLLLAIQTDLMRI